MSKFAIEETDVDRCLEALTRRKPITIGPDRNGGVHCGRLQTVEETPQPRGAVRRQWYVTMVDEQTG